MPSSWWAASSSHRTPESRSIVARSPGMHHRRARSARPSPSNRRSREVRSPRITWSSETPSSVTIEYSVPTDGRDCPLSSCEIRLADRPSRRASSRWLIPARTRSSRRRSPIPSSASGHPAASCRSHQHPAAVDVEVLAVHRRILEEEDRGVDDIRHRREAPGRRPRHHVRRAACRPRTGCRRRCRGGSR